MFFDISNTKIAQCRQKSDIILMILILKLPKIIFHKKYGPKLTFLNIKNRKIRAFFDIENKLLMSKFHDF